MQLWFWGCHPHTSASYSTPVRRSGLSWCTQPPELLCSYRDCHLHRHRVQVQRRASGCALPRPQTHNVHHVAITQTPPEHPLSRRGAGPALSVFQPPHRHRRHRRFDAQEIATRRFPERFSSPEALERLTASVTVLTPTTSTELVQRLNALEGSIIEGGAKLVIIDSIAALARLDFSRDQIVERQNALGQLAAKLKRLAEAFRIPILVTNQVTTRFGSVNGGGSGGGGGGGGNGGGGGGATTDSHLTVRAMRDCADCGARPLTDNPLFTPRHAPLSRFYSPRPCFPAPSSHAVLCV